jgi:hypothetical protein
MVAELPVGNVNMKVLKELVTKSVKHMQKSNT